MRRVVGLIQCSNVCDRVNPQKPLICCSTRSCRRAGRVRLQHSRFVGIPKPWRLIPPTCATSRVQRAARLLPAVLRHQHSAVARGGAAPAFAQQLVFSWQDEAAGARHERQPQRQLSGAAASSDTEQQSDQSAGALGRVAGPCVWRTQGSWQQPRGFASAAGAGDGKGASSGEGGEAGGGGDSGASATGSPASLQVRPPTRHVQCG